ncbi:MAG: hypothetical protein GX986_12135 [Firmicutes bacterium]|nr:hypothetical protein [Bacillota bacterium]
MSYTQLFGTKAGAIDDTQGLRIFGEESGTLVNIEPMIDTRVNVFEAEIAHFTDCIRTGKEPITVPRELVNVAKIIEAIYKSADNGGRQVLIADL